jgi:hypothetical protein
MSRAFVEHDKTVNDGLVGLHRGFSLAAGCGLSARVGVRFRPTIACPIRPRSIQPGRRLRNAAALDTGLPDQDLVLPRLPVERNLDQTKQASAGLSA